MVNVEKISQQNVLFGFLATVHLLVSGSTAHRNTRHAFGGEQLCTAAVGKPAECASSADGTHGKGRDDLAVYSG